MTKEQQDRLDVALAWRNQGAVSIQFNTDSDVVVTSVQFHSDVTQRAQQSTTVKDQE